MIRRQTAPAPQTLRDAIAFGARRFRAARLVYGHGTVNAFDEAVYLALHALRLPPGELAPHLDTLLEPQQRQAILELFERRIRERKPAAYLTREAWLGDFSFYVDERVIVPRSFIAELLRDNLAPWIASAGKIGSALDLCTGSGCLAILLAHSFPRARIDAADVSTAALAVARDNVRRYRLGRRIRLVRSDMFSALRGKRYDLIVSNPPYVRTSIMRRLPPEYRSEPPIALAGGSDGFALVRTLLQQAAQHLNPGGLLVVEVGHHRARVEKAFPRFAFTWPETSGGDDCVFLLTREQLPQ
ncbi:MAG: 50S ribosomal protein L3 N(5)-glutamine methyltransferase [Burkholderiales bacterium]